MDDPADPLEEWLSAARAGCLQSLGRILESNRRYLLLVAQQELDPVVRAKGGTSDLVQETFLEAQRDFSGFRGASAGEVRAWLRRLLLNNMINFTRRYRGTDKRQVLREAPLAADGDSRDPAGAVPANASTPSERVVRKEESAAMERAMGHLSDDHRQVLMLRYRDGLSFEEIGVLLQRSPNAARKLWERALVHLRQEWVAQGG
jgi:RNA polymerase sigma-70 factor (ECF subfamily)